MAKKSSSLFTYIFSYIVIPNPLIMYLALHTTAVLLLPAKASPTNAPPLSTGLPLSPLSMKDWFTNIWS
jgi:hypothetical protein